MQLLLFYGSRSGRLAGNNLRRLEKGGNFGRIKHENSNKRTKVLDKNTGERDNEAKIDVNEIWRRYEKAKDEMTAETIQKDQ